MERDAYFDNAKILLIFLVVFGHMIQPFIDESQGIHTLYMWIYTFHMPAFIFLAGFFAKGSFSKTHVFKLGKKLLLPYIIFQSLYSGYYFFIGKDGWQTGVFYPHWSLWFLFSLFSWNILLSVFKRLPAPISILIAIQLGLIVGYFGDIGHTFSLSRTFVFFPFFLMGYWATKKHMMILKQTSVKVGSVFVMVALALAIYVAPDINSGWLLASKSYGSLGMPEFGSFARLLVYVTSSLMAMSVLAWIPKKTYWITRFGTRTLYVYLLHGFFIQFFRETNLFEINSFFDLFGLGVISAVIVILLSSKPILGISQPLVEVKTSIIKKGITQKNG